MNMKVEPITDPQNEFAPFYLTVKDVKLMTTIGKTAIQTLETAGQFPSRIRINHSKVIWIYTDVYNWCLLVKKLGGYPPEGHYTL